MSADAFQAPAGLAHAPKPLRIFLSYGHDEFEELAVRLDNDLKARGHEVWFDKRDIKAGRDWEIYIEKGLEWVSQGIHSGWMVLLMTPHSVRRPGGYCLNELECAIQKQIPIVPVMVITVVPPVAINRLQYIDMTDCIPVPQRPASYERKFEELCSAIETEVLSVEGETNRLRRALNPPSYDLGTTYYLPRFTGRQRVFQAFDDWLANPAGPQVFWIIGPLGSGKSAIAAWLCEHRAEINAFHNCSLDKKHADPRQVVCSIAWQLSTQIPEFLQRLNAIEDIETLCRDEAADTLFNRLIIQPAHGIAARDRPAVVVIDALDEATHAGSNMLADLLGEELLRLPPCLRFVLTSGPEGEVTAPLQAWTPFELVSESADNIRDVTDYIHHHIAPFAPDGIIAPPVHGRLLEVSGCNWLYLEWVRRELEQGRLTLATVYQFPPGLGGVVHHEFSRRFPDPSDYARRHRPCLALVAAACEPLHMASIARIVGRSDSEVRDIIRDFGALLSLRSGLVLPFHHTLLGWLIDESKSGRYNVCQSDGHRDLARDCWAQFERGPHLMSDYAKRYLPLHLAAVGEKDKLERCVTDARFIGVALQVGKLYDLARFWKDIDRSRVLHRCAESFAELSAQAPDASDSYFAALGTGQLFQQVGMYEPAITYFKKVLRISHKLHEENAIGHAHLSIGWCLRHIDRFDEALDNAGAAIRHFDKSGNREGTAQALSVQGMCHWHLYDDMAALRDLEQSVALYEKVDDDRSQAEVLNHLGIVRRSLGLFDEALENLRQSEQLARRHKDMKGLGKCLNSFGTAYWWKGEHERAIDFYRRADEINSQVNQPYVLGLTANNLGYVYLEMDQPDRAYDSFCRAKSIRQELGIESYEMMDVSGMALACLRLGRVEEARELSRLALRVLRRYETVEDLQRAYHNHYLIMKDGSAPEHSEAMRALRRAQAIVAARMKRIKDEKILAGFLASVPLARELCVSSEEPTPKTTSPQTASRRTSIRSSAAAGRRGRTR
jgi:tetratricopeptide (TPR) repeat protein